jgi:lipoprotein-anchoring transpeptidase ErfK/SrfK
MKNAPESDLKLPEDYHVNTQPARRRSPSDPYIRRTLLGGCALAAGLAVTMAASPASAQYQWLVPSYQRPHPVKHKAVRKRVEQRQASKLPFGEIPKGPLEIFVSIEQQKLHFYSDGQLVATEPVATGVPGHLTPLGVFSVIERDRYHHSNLYSNAPMPFMERITWSGVALHEGPGVGHQASHGCIRMPGDFAARLFMLPTMGMRVIIARQELSPLPFADSHLFVHKDVPPTAALQRGVETAQQVAPGTKSDAEPAAAAPAKPAPAPDTAQSAQPDLRLNPAQPASAQPSQTAQAPQPSPGAATPAEPAKSPATDAKTAPASSAPAPAAAAATPQPAPAAPTATAAPGAAPASAPPVPGAVATAPAPADMTAPIAIDNVPIPLTKPARIAEGGDRPIAVFISRKTGKIYVRQNFTPLFDAPVKIDHPEQPLGTHVYTAMDYLPDHSTFRWTETTLPTATAARKVERWKYVKDQWGRRRRVRVMEQVAAPEDSQPASTPAEALARIQIPQDVIDQISQLMVPGSSLVVSDQGLGPETGDHTDFIVVTR